MRRMIDAIVFGDFPMGFASVRKESDGYPALAGPSEGEGGWLALRFCGVP
jgi:hypothetical protein